MAMSGASGASAVMNFKSGRSATGHGTMHHIHSNNAVGSEFSRSPDSASSVISPIAATVVVICSFVIAGGIVLAFVGYVAKNSSADAVSAEDLLAYRIAGPVLMGVGTLLMTVTCCCMNTLMKQQN